MEASRQLRAGAEPQVGRHSPEQPPARVIIVQRGGWRKDAKWVTGLLLVFLLLPTLLVATLFRLTSEEPAIRMIAAGLQGFFNYDELTAEELPSMQASARQKPGLAVAPDLPVPVTVPSSEVLKLGARDLQDLILEQSAAVIYRQGKSLDTGGKLAEQAAGGLMGTAGGPLAGALGAFGMGGPLPGMPPGSAPGAANIPPELRQMPATGKIDPSKVPPEMLPLLEQLSKGGAGARQGAGSAPGVAGVAPPDMAKTFDEFDRLIIGILSADTHRVLGSILRALSVVCLVLGGLFILFSRRWGRLGNPGTVLAYAAFPGVLLVIALQFFINPANEAPTQVFLLELESALRSVSGGVFLLGFVLSIVAALGGAVSFLLRRRSHAGKGRPTLVSSY